MSESKRVFLLSAWLPNYHLELWSDLRRILADRGVEFTIIQGDPDGEVDMRGQAASLDWTVYRQNRFFRFGGRTLIWQRCTDVVLDSDLVIVDEGSRLLLNYWLLAKQRRRKLRVAYWGHVGNLNAFRASRLSEALKRRISRLPHWWFAYTEGAKRRLIALDYSAERVTVVQSSIPTESLRRRIAALTSTEIDELRKELNLGDGPIALFLGSLYEDKRVEYLLEAADRAYERLNGFHLVIAGDGPKRRDIELAASTRPYVRIVGSVDGAQKARLLAAADVLLLPGAVGLALVDGFAAGLPTITTSVPTHGPEIEYLEDGVNGLILPADTSPSEYGEKIDDVLTDDVLRTNLAQGAAASGSIYTGASMVSRFADGIESALSTELAKGPSRSCRFTRGRR
jgi:glycosyltransferase involved in cell wall biosynthesis